MINQPYRVLPIVVTFGRYLALDRTEKTTIRLEVAVAERNFSIWSFSSPIFTFNNLKDLEIPLMGFIVEACEEIPILWNVSCPVKELRPRYIFYGLDLETEEILKKDFESFFLTGDKAGV